MYKKSECILFMLKTLFESGSYSKEEIDFELELPDLTFHRYNEEIRNFLMEFEPSWSLVYDRVDKIYLLKK